MASIPIVIVNGVPMEQLYNANLDAYSYRPIGSDPALAGAIAGGKLVGEPTWMAGLSTQQLLAMTPEERMAASSISSLPYLPPEVAAQLQPSTNPFASIPYEQPTTPFPSPPALQPVNPQPLNPTSPENPAGYPNVPGSPGYVWPMQPGRDVAVGQVPTAPSTPNGWTLDPVILPYANAAGIEEIVRGDPRLAF